ncbi:MAG: L,D-transpeptidase [Corynebacterium sp.]|nr:L,D-transpeptidase [Corynebacterium sp.]
MRTLRIAAAGALAGLTLIAGATGGQAHASALDDFNNGVRENAWNTHVNVYNATENSPQVLRDIARGATDGVVNAIAPGVIVQKDAEIQAAKEAAERAEAERQAAEAAARAEAERQAAEDAARAASGFDYGPCPKTAKVCVDIDGHRSWLQENGVKSYGPVPISSGKPGQETTRGDLKVLRKVKNEVSYEFNMAPMPNSVYFTNTGMAFHAGSPAVASAGCVHLNYADSEAYFNYLNVGDEVFIY